VRAVTTFTRLFFVPVKHRALPQDMRVQPTW
jgi:hypothetical protein